MARVLKDQRDIYGGSTPAEVRRRWDIILARGNAERRARGMPPVVLVADARIVAAYVNHGRWVADCPECGGGIGGWPASPDGACLDCGHVYAVAYPPDWNRAEDLLGRRPPRHRHWRCDRGETVTELEAEDEVLGQ
jgi:hypothetical protein